MLLADPLVLDRHLPARERHEPRPGFPMALDQRRPAKGVCGGRQPPAGYPLTGAPLSTAARRHSSTATARPNHPWNGRSGVCWARRTPRTPSGSRTSSTCAWTCSAADMRQYSCRNAPMASGAPPNPTPNFEWTRIPTCSNARLSSAHWTARWPTRSRGAGASSPSRAHPGSASRAWWPPAGSSPRHAACTRISVRGTELERSYPYGIVRQTADSVVARQDAGGARRAVHGRGTARTADPRSRQRRGGRQPGADVPAAPRPLLGHREPRPRAAAADHDRRRPVGRRGVDGRSALPQPADRRPPHGAAAGGADDGRGPTARPARGDARRPRHDLDPARPALRGGRRPARRGPAGQHGRGVRGGLPQGHGRQPVPAGAAPERGQGRGHRADRRRAPPGSSRWARTRCAPRSCSGSSGCRARAAPWRARSRSSASTTWRSGTSRRWPTSPRTRPPTRSPSWSARGS